MKYITFFFLMSFPFLSNSQDLLGLYNKELNLQDKKVFIECIALYKIGNCIVIETENSRCCTYYIIKNYVKNNGTIIYYLINNSNKQRTILKVKDDSSCMYLDNNSTNLECIFVLEGKCK